MGFELCGPGKQFIIGNMGVWRRAAPTRISCWNAHQISTSFDIRIINLIGKQTWK